MPYWIRKIKYFIQRGCRGYSDEDTYDFWNHLTSIIPPAVRQLKQGIGCPSEYWDGEKKNDECHKWRDVLEEIAQGFEAADWIARGKYFVWKKSENGCMEHSVDDLALKIYTAKMERGLDLFAKNFLGLWD